MIVKLGILGPRKKIGKTINYSKLPDIFKFEHIKHLKSMYTAVKGIYENGVLTFKETPPSIEKSEVVILFLEEGLKREPLKRGVVLGSQANKGYNIPDDFNDLLEDFKDYM